MWSIALLKNTLKVPPGAVPELFAISEKRGLEIWYTEREVTDKKGYIQFNHDHMEHMDFLTNKEIQDVLKTWEAKGSVRFGSLEGDNKGEFWGYFFDGKGGMRRTVGELVWKRVREFSVVKRIDPVSVDPWG